MRDVQYFAPTDLGEALRLLSQYGAAATVLAGGTDLVPKINHYEIKPEVVLYIGRLGLDDVRVRDGTMIIGAATRMARLATDPVVAAKAPALAAAAQCCASVAIRTSATIGGNVANASPAADLVPPLVAMDAAVYLVSARGERQVAVKDFATGPHETALAPDELITEFHVPVPGGKTAFLKLGRRKAQTLSVVNVAVQLTLAGGSCQEARIAVGAMAPRVVRCQAAEALLVGRPVDAGLIAQAAAAAVSETMPVDDGRASAWYRRKAGQALIARALTAAAGLS